jgi:glucokinase
MVIKADGPLCKCGKSGCLEALASGWAVARDAKELLKGGGKSSILRLAGGKIEAVTAATVALAAREGDTLAQKIIADAAHYLGVGLANIVDIFNPELIVIGGGLAKMGNMLLDPARKAAKKAAFGLPGRTVRIVRARFVNNAGILGAAAYAFNQTQKEAGG